MPVKVRAKKGKGNFVRGDIRSAQIRPNRRKHLLTDIDGNPIPEGQVTTSPIGRKPIQITDDLIDRITTLVRAGNFIGPAVRAAGISVDTFKRWMVMVSEDSISKIKTEEEFKKLEMHMKLAEGIVQAASDAEVDRVEIIDKSAQLGQWGAAAWWLSHRHPQRWGKRTFVSQTIDAHHEHVHSVAENILSDKSFTSEAIDLFEETTETTDLLNG